MGDILIKMNNLEEAVKVCASLTTRDLTHRSVRLRGMCYPVKWDSVLLHGISYPPASDCAVCDTLRSETASYYTGSHTPQCQTVRYVIPRKVRQRLTTRYLIPRSVSVRGMPYPARWDVSQSMKPGFRAVRLCGPWCFAELDSEVCQAMQSKPMMIESIQYLTWEVLKILSVDKGREQECIMLSTMHSLWCTFYHFQFFEKF